MADKPDLTERQEQILRALVAERLAADIDPLEVGGLADDELTQQLEVSQTDRRTPRLPRYRIHPAAKAAEHAEK